MAAVDRWGPKTTQGEKKLTPEQFLAAWQHAAAKLLRGEPMPTEAGGYFVRCGRRIEAAKFCLLRLGHSATCSPHFANVCDAPLPKGRCVLTAGHKGKCLPHFPGSNR